MTDTSDVNDSQGSSQNIAAPPGERNIPLDELIRALRDSLKLLVVAPLVVGVLTLGVTSQMTPVFTATTTFMPPQQTSSGAASALASLGSLSSLAGLATGASPIGSSADRYVALMQSVTVLDRMVDRFKLVEVYEAKFRVDARNSLAKNVRINVARKGGLISVEVDDESPQRAADMANRFLSELRQLTGTLAVTEAQQRRLFFEQQLMQSRDRLVQAQQALQGSGFNAGALKAEPRAAADAYARLKAELTTAEIRLQTLRGSLTERAPEVLRQQSELAALKGQLARAENSAAAPEVGDYLGKYREFKYQEAIFELYARQFEIARVDESREGALIQVVDPATAPERRSRPKRAFTTAATTLATLLTLAAFVLVRYSRRRTINQPASTVTS